MEEMASRVGLKDFPGTRLYLDSQIRAAGGTETQAGLMRVSERGKVQIRILQNFTSVFLLYYLVVKK